jgi:hypothetical protein
MLLKIFHHSWTQFVSVEWSSVQFVGPTPYSFNLKSSDELAMHCLDGGCVHRNLCQQAVTSHSSDWKVPRHAHPHTQAHTQCQQAEQSYKKEYSLARLSYIKNGQPKRHTKSTPRIHRRRPSQNEWKHKAGNRGRQCTPSTRLSTIHRKGLSARRRSPNSTCQSDHSSCTCHH